MEENKNKSILEAILFACGEPVETERIAQVMQLEQQEVDRLADLLAQEYDEKSAGFQLIRLNQKLQLCSRPEYFDYVRDILELKRNTPLSQAAFEVLSVVAYNQPVTKSVIEQVRGVDCSGVIASLCEKGLIEEKGRLDLPGRPLLYGTTDDFLRCFSMRDLSDLPPLPEDPESSEETEDSKESTVPVNTDEDLLQS